MKNNMKNFLKGLTVGLLGVSMIASVAYAATLNFVQTPSTALYASMSASATSMRITPYPKDLNGTKLTMTDFGTTPTVTIDPKKLNYEEIVSFTGITDNGDNTATLTGLSHLTSKSPYTTTVTGKTHGAGATVVFSNNPQMYARLAALENTEAITGLWAFATSPTVPTPSSGTQAANKSYVDGVVAAGVATSTEANFGGVWLATQLQMASSTYSANAPAVLYSRYATSSPGSAGLWIPITQNNGKLNPNFIATSSSDTYNFGGNVSFTASTTLSATTTISASSVTNNALILNKLPYKFPSTRAASSTVLSEDGNGSLTFESQSTGAISTTTTIALPTSGGTVSQTVYCVSPKVVSGGGYSGVGEGGGSLSAWFQIPTASYPSATNSWTVSVNCSQVNNGSSTCSSGTLTVYAICVNP